MLQFKLKQLQYEVEGYKRLLVFMIDENIHFKNRLSEIIKDNYNNPSLEFAEQFQSNFIKEDQLIELLRNEIAELDKLLVREIFEDGKVEKKVSKLYKQLNKKINISEKQFNNLKKEFNSYIKEFIYNE